MNNQFNYTIALKNNSYRLADVISILLCSLTLISFTFLLVIGSKPVETYIITITVISIELIFNYYRKRKGLSINHNYSFAICFVAWLTVTYKNGVLAVLYLVALFTEMQVKKPQEIGVNEEGITINVFPKKFFQWANFVNVLIKDNILTIDFKNNKILQKETQTNISHELQREFNEFCRQQLANIGHLS